ncbi:MAG: 50S ribosomal protein L23 [Patescibacteria group bacterium]|nr:50S ribosomal protein L23 [Patescibacteria group bacterium]
MAFWNKFKFKKKPFKEGAPAEKVAENIPMGDHPKGGKIETPEVAPKPKKEGKKTEKPVEKLKKVKKEDTGDAFRILICPIISEKVTGLSALNQYVFEVSPRASKNEIKKAIKNVYGVAPIRIRVISVLGKRVRFGRNFGKLKDRKKAIITLKKGETIQVYEGV